MKKYSKLLALVLAVLMLGATATATFAGILNTAAEGNIASDSPKKMDAWSSNAEGRGPQQVLGTHFCFICIKKTTSGAGGSKKL